MMSLDTIQKLYFIGIGGIGMSAIARYFNGLGKEIYGYDKTETTLTKKLVEEGMQIHYEESVEKIPAGIDLVVYTPAVPRQHVELVYFQTHNFPVMKRAAVLGLISQYRKTIAVAGTHGKTTTSSMLTHLLKSGGIDCTAFLGGIAQNFSSNFVQGHSDWVVAEADEFDRSFLHLSPDLAVVTSMDPDHLDIYGDHKQLLDSGFLAFAKKLKVNGKIWVQAQYADYFQEGIQAIPYGIEAGKHQANNIKVVNGAFEFDYKDDQYEIKSLRLPMPGKHNVENATAAISIALELGISPAAIRKALLNFKGIQRRFEIVFQNDDHTYIDDYAHHPTELTAAISAAKMLFPDKKICGVFQPHLFSRTRDFLEGFANALSLLDELLLMDIYPARELPIEGISSERILALMDHPNAQMVKWENILETIEKRKPEVLMTLGAGSINRFVEPIRELFINNQLKK